MNSVAFIDRGDSGRLWRNWITANAAGELLGLGAVAGVGLMMVGVVDSMPTATTTAITGAMMVLLGLLEGYVVGMAQWRVLRHHVERAGRWIPANSIAWMLGMPVIFLGIDIASSMDSLVATVAVILSALSITGAVVGAIHGWQLLRFMPATSPAK